VARIGQVLAGALATAGRRIGDHWQAHWRSLAGALATAAGRIGDDAGIPPWQTQFQADYRLNEPSPDLE
jgi:hypothetical protein